MTESDAPKRGRGRPPKNGPDGLPLDVPVRFRCTSLQGKSWNAKAAGAPDLSDWIRAALDAAPSWDKLQRGKH